MPYQLEKLLQGIRSDEHQLEDRKNEARDKALALIRRYREIFDIKIDELDFSPKSRAITRQKTSPHQPDRRHAPVPPKYRGPNGELWSGRGKQPLWFLTAIQTGYTAEEMQVAGSASQEDPPSRPQRASANGVMPTSAEK